MNFRRQGYRGNHSLGESLWATKEIALLKWPASIVYSEKSWGRSLIWNKRQRDLNCPQKIMFSFVWLKKGRLSINIYYFSLCVHACVCVDLCMCGCMCFCVSVCKPEDNIRQYSSGALLFCLPCFMREDLSWPEAHQVGKVTKAQGSTVYASQAPGLWYVYSTMCDIPHTCYGDQTQVPMLCDKHFTDWVISPALRFIISLPRN